MYDDYATSYLVVSSNEHPNFEINQFNSYEDLLQIDSDCQARGYHLKSIDKYGTGTMTAGIAMWHFQTEFSLKLNRDGEYKNLISVEETQGYLNK